MNESKKNVENHRQKISITSNSLFSHLLNSFYIKTHNTCRVSAWARENKSEFSASATQTLHVRQRMAKWCMNLSGWVGWGKLSLKLTQNWTAEIFSFFFALRIFTSLYSVSWQFPSDFVRVAIDSLHCESKWGNGKLMLKNAWKIIFSMNAFERNLHCSKLL